ncbi:Ribosome-releasing factor 2, mitochondrial, partial [Ascosphaera pollenicola]
LPHDEVRTEEFYKHIEGEGLPEPRRMRQLLTWCATRAIAQKPVVESPDDQGALLVARVIQDEILKEFSIRSELSDWFSREDADSAAAAAVVRKPNPKNEQNSEKIRELEAQIERLRKERETLRSLMVIAPVIPEVYTPKKESGDDDNGGESTASTPSLSKVDVSLLDPVQQQILTSLSLPPLPSSSSSIPPEPTSTHPDPANPSLETQIQQPDSTTTRADQAAYDAELRQAFLLESSHSLLYSHQLQPNHSLYALFCLTEWFSKNKVRKTCPECRALIKSQPGPAYLVRDIVHYFTQQQELLGEGESVDDHFKSRVEELDHLEADKANTDPNSGGLFRGCFNDRHLSPIRDIEDGVIRCPRCTHELEDGQCNMCGYTTYHSDDDSQNDDDDDDTDENDDDDMENETDYDEDIDDHEMLYGNMSISEYLHDIRNYSDFDDLDAYMGGFITDASVDEDEFSASDNEESDAHSVANSSSNANGNTLHQASHHVYDLTSDDESGARPVTSESAPISNTAERGVQTHEDPTTRPRRSRFVELSESDEEPSQGPESHTQNLIGAGDRYPSARIRRRIDDDDDEEENSDNNNNNNGDEEEDSIVLPPTRRRRLGTYRVHSDTDESDDDTSSKTKTDSSPTHDGNPTFSHTQEMGQRLSEESSEESDDSSDDSP